MPRDNNGNYTLPAGNPVIPGTIIAASWANPTMADIGQALTDSLDRFGRGAMQSAIRFPDGTLTAPSIAFANELTTGMFRAGNSDLRVGVAGVSKVRYTGTNPFQVFLNGVWQTPLYDTSAPTLTGLWNWTGVRPQIAGVNIATVNDTPNLTNYTQRNVAEAISAIWNFTAVPTINGVNIATVADIPTIPNTYVQRNVAEAISAVWTFSAGATFSAATTFSSATFNGAVQSNALMTVGTNGDILLDATASSAARIGTRALGGSQLNVIGRQDAADVLAVGSIGLTTNINSTSHNLWFNGANLNTPNGLVEVGANGKIPIELLALSALEFQGTWDASTNTLPPNGTVGGQFYVINVAGTLLVYVDNTGTPVSTAVFPGDWLIWLAAGSGYTSGWYLLPKIQSDFIAAANVTYDPAAAPWTTTDAQATFDQIGTWAALKDRSQSIAGTWNYTGSRPQIGGVNIATVNDVPTPPDLSAYTQRAVAETITADWIFTTGLVKFNATPQTMNSRYWSGLTSAGANRSLIGIDSSDVVLVGTASLDVNIQGSSIGPKWNNNVVNALNGFLMNDVGAHTLTGLWNWTGQRPQIGGVNIATVNDTPNLAAYTQRAVAETISVAWTFGAGVQANTWLRMPNNTPIQGLSVGTVYEDMLKWTATDRIQLGNGGFITDLIGSNLEWNGALLNQANGLLELDANGKVPFANNSLSGLTFIGLWDASPGNLPPNGPGPTEPGGQYYIINVAGTLLVYVDDSGTPVSTFVNPGDYIIWASGFSGGLTPGYYLIVREAGVFTPATNVLYDKLTTPWASDNVQTLGNEIGVRATLRDRTETITSAWTFSAEATFQGASFSSSVVVNSNFTVGVGNATFSTPTFITPTGTTPLTLERTGSDQNVSINIKNTALSRFFGLGSDGSPYWSEDASLTTGGRLLRHNVAETVSAAWTFGAGAVFSAATTHTQADEAGAAILLGQSTARVGLGAIFPLDLNATVGDGPVGTNRFIQTGISPANPPPQVSSNRWAGMEFGMRVAGGYKTQMLFPQSGNEMFLRNIAANVPTEWKQVAFKSLSVAIKTSSYTLLASDNNSMIIHGGSPATVQQTLNAQSTGFNVRIVAGAANRPVSLLKGTLTTLRWLDGAGAGPVTVTSMTIAPGGVADIVYDSAGTCYAVGTGLTGTP